MDEKNVIILDISSDEDDGGGRDDFCCISKVLDGDDCVILDGDDCVILDGDPDKPVTIDNQRKDDVDDDSGELMIISEKGQVACRDFPHPRHHCAKFPYASTPHERHCDQCHCYVCESRAPCVLWGSGISTIDHCHANDKERYWKAQRRNRRINNNAPPAVPSLKDGTFSFRRVLTNQSPPLTSNRMRQASIWPCSVATGHGTANFTRQGGSQHPGHVVPRSRFHPYLVNQHLNGLSNDVILSDKAHNTGHIIPRRKMVRRTRSPTRPILDNGFANHVPQISSRQQLTGHFANSAPARPLISEKFGNLPPSQSVTACQPLEGDDFENLTPRKRRCQVISPTRNYSVPSQPMVSPLSTFESPSSPQAQEYSQSTFVFNNTQDAFASASADSDFLSLFNYSRQNCQQLSSDNFQTHSAVPTNNLSADIGLYSPHSPGSRDFGHSDLQFDNWLLGNQSA